MNEKANKKMSIRTQKSLIIIFILIFGFAAIFCGFKYFSAQSQYKKSLENYEALAKEYVAPRKISVVAGAENLDQAIVSPIEVDFDELTAQAARGEVAAWLYSEGTVINYPVMHCDDNEFYLNHQLDGAYNACGTLFIDCKCAADFSSPNTIIYGHHMADGQMFNSLKKYRGVDGYYEEHPCMYINTPEGNYELLIYSTFVSDTQSMAFKTSFANDDELQGFIDYTIKESLLKADVDVTTEDHVVTLVTCSYETNNSRTIVCGKLVPIG